MNGTPPHIIFRLGSTEEERTGRLDGLGGREAGGGGIGIGRLRVYVAEAGSGGRERTNPGREDEKFLYFCMRCKCCESRSNRGHHPPFDNV